MNHYWNMYRRTTTVIVDGARLRAYAERGADGAPVVRVYDDVAGHFTVVHSLTPGQVRHVIGRTIRLQGAAQ
jgi:hypothetical protein